MLVGHFAAAFVAKRVEPKVSLGTYALAAMLPDLLWPVFLLGGIEHAHYKAGMGAAKYLDTSDAALNQIALSHSLLTGVLWGALFAGSYFFMRRYALAAWVIFAAVVSHWILDAVSLRMPLAPRMHKYLGAGLWNSIPATVIVEGGLWVVGIIVYVRATQAKTRSGVLVFWIVVGLLTLVWYHNIAGAPPPDPRAAPVASLILFSLLVAWAYWMNRVRPARAAGVEGTR